MKYVQRLSALLLALVVLVGLIPTNVFGAASSTYSGTPTADIMQVVIDYGKPVLITLAEVKAGIHLNGKGSVGSLAGFVASGSSGELVDSVSISCNTTGKTLGLTYGTITWSSDSTLTYTPNGMLGDVEYVYAVYALSSSTKAYIKVEIQIIPANMMYYEAEELPESTLTTYDTTTGQTGGTKWGTKPEGSSGNDNQTYDNIDVVSSMVVDRKQIPGGVFFVDFDGTGKNNRYDKDPIYNGCNFDNASYWNYGTAVSDEVLTTPGHYILNLTSGNNSHYFQTTTSGGATTTQPLYFRAGINDYYQIRLRMVNCKSATSVKVKIQLKRASDSTADVNASNVYHTLNATQLAQLNNEEYVTVTKSLATWDYYTQGNRHLAFRFTVEGVEAETGGQLIVDYVYVGGSTGLKLPKTATTTRDYVYFGFDSWMNKAYYDGCSVDGTMDFSVTTNWHSDSASSGVNGSTGITFSTSQPGYIKIKDGTSSDVVDIVYNFVQPGPAYNSAPLKYTTHGTDYFKIRFKCTGGSKEGTPTFTLEYKLSGENSYRTSSATKTFSISNSWQVITIDPNITRDKVVTNIRPVFRNTQKCTFYIDYFALYSDTLPKKTDDAYLFMDFNPNVNDLNRFMRGTYGSQDFNNYNHLVPKTNTKLSKWTSAPYGVIMEDETPTGKNSDGEADKNDTSRIYMRANNLAFTPADNHYVQMRLKIDSVTDYTVSHTDIDGTAKPWVDFWFNTTNTDSDKVGGYLPSAKRRYIDMDTEIGEWLTITIPITHSEYNLGFPVSSIIVAVRGTQAAKVTVDYIYVGPPIWDSKTDAFNPLLNYNPANKSLYFGFDNNDSTRYSSSTYSFNDTYGSKNYDNGNWTVSGNGSSTSYSSANGIASIALSTANYNGPIFTSGALKYHPYNADVLQTRFRLNGCQTNPSGDPRLEARITGYLGNASKIHTISKPFADTNNFQTITLAMKSELQKFTTVTKIELQFYDIQGGILEIDHIYLGDGTISAIPTYGTDSAYSNHAKLSDGDSLFVNGKGIKVLNSTENSSYSEASFSFTGTGFDIISRTGYDQATIRLEIYDQAGNKERTMSVNNKGDLELYQIPIVSVHGLAHGTYTVYIWVNKGVTSSYPFLQRGDHFYLDAIRIYDPINVNASNRNKSQQAALDAYRADREAYAYVKEIRDTLLNETNFTAALLGNGTTGALFVDSVIEIPNQPSGSTEPSEVIGDHRVVTAAEYRDIGPKNEVYLSPGQAIVFKFEKDTNANPVSVDIGAKAVLGDTTNLTAGFVTVTDSSALTVSTNKKWTVNTATAQYYSLNESSLSTGTAVYLVIYNSNTGTDKTKNILSITNLKVCYDKKPTRTDLPQDSSSVGFDVSSAKRELTQELEIDPYHFSVDSRTLEAAEVFLNGIVVPETPIEDTPTLVEGLRIYHSLNLASDIAVNFVVPAEDLEGYDTFSMSISVNDYEEGDRLFMPEAVRSGDYYYFTLSNLTAVQMNDEIEATLYMTKDGKDYCSLTDTYSIADYAYGQLAKDNAPDGLKALCADLLVYGAKAQLYKDYRTDSLADMAMTDVQRVYCSDLDAVVFGNTNVTGAETEDPTVIWAGKALELNSRVSVIYCVDLSGFRGSPEELTMKISYLDLDGVETTVTLRDPVPYEGKENCYKFTFDGLLAAELRTVLTAQAYVGDEAVSNSLTYSPDTYGMGKTGILAELCKALFAYSDSAKAYFSN